ncbi:CLUMA_CG011438, isoform A [Clunio marinus]|uniref:CLUMA_CG011438, isoform A n=1 Tax=Clunio marinus TaxID=568069 RepID=A0A1J1ICR2_9DIPT|nr:CLUMA_CG011438, isoform A [Clunio marinus]
MKLPSVNVNVLLQVQQRNIIQMSTSKRTLNLSSLIAKKVFQAGCDGNHDYGDNQKPLGDEKDEDDERREGFLSLK